MTDLEICKRIAEIEGLSEHRFRNYCNAEYDDECRLISVDHYNPLTDKALCFDLMVKYQISIEPQQFNLTYAHINCEHAVLDENPQRAICLAIIDKSER